MVRLAEILADYVINFSIENEKEDARKLAGLFFKDCFGCLLAGANEKAVQIIRQYGISLHSEAAASVLGVKNVKTDSCTAAMINATASHIHDYDDVSTSVTGHPSVVVLPTVIAVGEEVNATGKEMMEAYMLGIEVIGLAGRGFNPEHYSKGWHNTGTLGIFGAVAAAGKLKSLSKEQLVHAFAIAASRSAGLKGNFGTMTKSLHAGLAASNGIFAASVAKLGFEANPDIFEIDGGFTEVTTGKCNLDAIVQFIEAGDSEFIHPGLACKPFPSCKATHNGINAAMNLKAKYDFSVEDIEHIQVGCQPVAKDLLKYPNAKTPLEGKFSMNYCIASCLVNNGLGIRDFEGEVITDRTVLELMSKISMEIDQAISGDQYFNGTWETAVTIYLKNGQSMYERVRFAVGDPENPLSEEQLNHKFMDCVSRIVDIEKCEKMMTYIDHPEAMTSVSDLTSALQDCLMDD